MSSLHEPAARAKCQCNSRHSPAREPLTAPFRVIADFREALDGWQFTNLPDWKYPDRLWTVPVEYRYLETADYTVPELSLFVVRHNANHLLATLRHWPESISQQLAELSELQAAGASCLLVIEGDAEAIRQVLRFSDLVAPGDPSSSRSTSDEIPWLLADSQPIAEQLVFECMYRAWHQAQTRDSTSL